MTNQEIHLAKELDKLKQENLLMKKIATTNGFYQYYFEQLKSHKTNIDCFNYINELYYNYFKEYKYSCYNSFKNQIKKYLKK